MATAEKSHEITAIPQLLNLIDVKGAVVTIDAKIVDGGGDYLLPLKGNQSQMEQAVREFFTDHLEDDFARVKVSRLETTETHHGRVEKRSYFQVNVPDALKGRSHWKGLRTLGLRGSTTRRRKSARRCRSTGTFTSSSRRANWSRSTLN